MKSIQLCVLAVQAVTILLFSTHCVSQNEIYPPYLPVPTSDTLSLNCLSTTSETVSYSWLKSNGDDLVSVTGDGVVLNGSELMITDFHGSTHARRYYCLTSHVQNNKTYASCPAIVTHAKIMAGPFLVDPVNTTALVNSTVVLACEPPVGEPDPVIQWKKDNQLLDPSLDPRLVVLPTGDLYISDVLSTDSGQYQCIARNPITESRRRSQHATLTVIHPPLNHTAPPSVSARPFVVPATLGGKAVFECVPSGYPPPRVYWEKLHSQQFPAARLLRGGAIIIDPVTVEHAGTYRCIVISAEGKAQDDVELEVKEPPLFSVTPPGSVTVISGDTDTLVWEIQAQGVMLVTIFHNGQVLESLSAEGMARVSHTIADGAGIYQCIVENSGSCIHNDVDVSIVMPTPSPVTETTPLTDAGSGDGGLLPSTLAPVDLVVMVDREIVWLVGGRPTSIVCTAPFTSIDDTLQWLSSSAEVLPEAEYVITDGVLTSTLTVNSPGQYTCRAVWFGRQSDSATVTVLSNDVPPLMVTSSEGPLSVDLGQSQSLFCKIEGGGVNVSVRWFFNDIDLQSSVETMEDYLFSQYHINSVAVRDAGDYVCEAYSPELGVRIDASITIIVLEPVLGPPLNVSYEYLIDGRVHLTWAPPSHSMNILGYKINRGTPETSPQVALYSVGPDTHAFTVPAELPADGTLLIWAYSLAEDGIPVRIDLQPFKPVLGPPLNVSYKYLIDGHVHLTWAPPSHAMNILGYKINRGTPETSPQVALYSVGPDTHAFTVPAELPADGTLLIWAYSLAEDGIPVRIDLQPFRETYSCSVGSQSPTSALLNLPPALAGEDISLVYSCSQAMTSLNKVISTATTAVQLTGLLPSCKYSFEVSYSGDKMLVCETTTPPGQVDISPSVRRYDNGSVSLRWILPEELRLSKQLIIEVNWGTGWLPVATGQHVPVHFDRDDAYTIEFRLRVGEWVGVANITVPEATPIGDRGNMTSDLGLLYGVIFGGLFVSCAVVVALILTLKYVQMSRRESDKVSEQKETERDNFRRMSLERVSINSIKKSPISSECSASTDEVYL